MSLILVDGSALVYRAYYAFASRPLQSGTGEQTSVVFGFLNSLLRLIEEYRPRYLGVSFDVKGPTFRHEIYDAYKAHRKPMPEDMAAQLPRLREVLAAWGLRLLEKPGYEADDVMATLARSSKAVCDQAWFYSGDKDFMQLLDRRTGMLKPGRRGDEITPLTIDDVRRRYRLEPPALVDVFALSGDSSDNIPGAPGVGEKTAIKLIQQFGSLEGLYDNLADKSLTPRLRRVLQENREQVLLSRRLFCIDAAVPLDVAWSDLRMRLPAQPRFHELMQVLGLRRVMALADRLSAAGIAAEDPASSTTPAAPAPVKGRSGGAKKTVAEVKTRLEPTVAPATEPGANGISTGADEDPRVAKSRDRGYVICHNEKELQSHLEKIAKDAPCAVDTETDDLRCDTARLVGISLAAEGAAPAYVPVLQRKPDGTGESQAATLFAPAAERSHLDWVQRQLAPVLADQRRLKIGQNLKFDEWILTRHGLPLRGPRFDTMIAAYVLDPGRQRYGLDDLARENLGVGTITYAELFQPGDRQRDILGVALPLLATYAAEDADVTFRLYRRMREQISAAGLDRLFYEIEMPLSAVLFRMEHNGIKIDGGFLGVLHERFSVELQELERRIQIEAGEDFNVQSPKQLADILFGKLKLKPLKKTATGWSTDMSVLSVLAEQHPLPALVLEHRQLAKLQNTYVESLPQLVNPQTGLIHTSFNQAVAATGRLSSSDPNLQNIPIRTAQGRLIRQAFIPRREDHVLLSADYSQVELRLLAHLSGDEQLCRAFREGGDVHRRTAALIAGKAEDEVTGAMRRRAKAINFGVIYGMGARALAKQIGVSVKEAKTFIETYFETYPGVRAFIDEAKDKARRAGWTETLLGRRRRLPDILSENNRLRSFQERIAVNTPIQGTAADVIKLAMIAIDERLRSERLRSMLLLQVHDELLLEAPRSELDRVRSLVRECMESVMALDVPLTVDIHVGANWAEAHE